MRTPQTIGRRSIVLAWTDMTGMRDTGQMEQRDRNWFTRFEPCFKAHACMWLNDGGDLDLIKARDYADKEGYSVLTFPLDEPDPLGKARAAVLHAKQPTQ